MNNIFMQKLPSGSKEASWTFDFDPPIVGRFVRVQKSDMSTLTIAEVEVIGTPASTEPVGLLANYPYALATQSSTCSAHQLDTPGVASRAINGITDGQLGQYTYTCNVEGEYQWVSLRGIWLCTK